MDPYPYTRMSSEVCVSRKAPVDSSGKFVPWELTGEGHFLNANKLNRKHWRVIAEWARNKGYITPADIYVVQGTDQENRRRYRVEFSNPATAASELGLSPGDPLIPELITKEHGWIVSAALAERLNWRPEFLTLLLRYTVPL